MPEEKAKKPLAPLRSLKGNTAESEVFVRQGTNFIEMKTDFSGLIFTGFFGVIGVTVLIAAVIIGGSIYELNLQKQLDTYSQNLASLSASVETENEFINKFSTLQSKLQLLTDQEQAEQMLEFFPIMSALLPKNVMITSMNIQPTTVQIVVRADNREVFADFVRNVRTVDGYKFSDGVVLSMSNLNFRNVAQDTMTRLTDPDEPEAYEATLSFNYTLGETGEEV